MEAFALATDRTQFLEGLIPGTEDYYHYHCLHALHEQRHDDCAELLKRWYDKHRHSSRWRNMKDRFALCVGGEESYPYLIDRLGLRFDHQREVEGTTTSYPTRLDPERVSRETFKQSAYGYSGLGGFADPALEWLPGEGLEDRRRRELLDRLQRADHPQTMAVVLAELRDHTKPDFGNRSVHQRLTREQLEQLVWQLPELEKQDRYVHAYLERLAPGAHVDLETDLAAREAYLEQVWPFVQRLAPAFNALKVHVLYHWLELDRRRGRYDRERFLRYLQLPRQAHYTHPDYLRRDEHRHHVVSLGQPFESLKLGPAPGDDEELVRDYLAHFFAEAADWKPYDTFVRHEYLKRLFATTKILLGQGDGERWYSLLDDPGYYQQLKDRVDIEFAHDNPQVIGAEQPVSLDAYVKNVERLVVRVFRINALNYFLAEGREPDASLDLDGLVASQEETHSYGEPPLRRVRRTFSFPELTEPGTYVVELIGGGLSSRALIRKGRLRFLERTGAAGHVFHVLDEANQHQREASLWLSGREYSADEDGEIHVPFSTEPGPRRILLRAGTLASQDSFQHRAESYEFAAGIHVERESLLKRRQAEVVVRPRLTLHGQPVKLSLIEEPRLLITAHDREGTASTQEVALELQDERDTVHAFQVAEGLAQITFTLQGKVKQVSTGKRIDLSAQQSFTLNTIDGTNHVQSLHLTRTAAGYVLYLLGKTGEPRADVPVNVDVHHRDFTFTISNTLQTDAGGRVELGQLPGITRLEVHTGDGTSNESWTLLADRCQLPGTIHAAQGDTIRVPYLGARGAVTRDAFALFELRSGHLAHDHFEALRLQDGYLVASGLPPGTFRLTLKEHEHAITIRIVPGRTQLGWVTSPTWLLERRYPQPLQIQSVEGDGDGLRVQLGNATTRTRLHVYATRYLPAYDAHANLGAWPLPGPRASGVGPALSTYQSGRDIGDEYRYVLERARGQRFPGNMLTRPGLLLNPWSIRKTDTGLDQAAEGGAYGAGARSRDRADVSATMAQAAGQAHTGGLFANLDFLADPAGVALNLTPDERGMVRVPAEVLAHGNHVRLVALDPLQTVVRDVVRPEVDDDPDDLTLRLALDPEAHFVERKQATALKAGETLNVEDITTAKVESYDSLSRVFRLYATLSEDPDLETFRFLLRWPQLSPAEKQAKYSEHACHELSFFISRRDPEFFRRVVQPYLRSKRAKTFLDHYLLEDDLSEFLEPWAYQRLNVVERILLAGRLDGEGDPTARHLDDLLDLLGRDVEHQNHLFRTALRGSSLETEDGLGFAQAADVARQMVMSQMVAPAVAGGLHMGGGGPRGGATPARARREKAKKSRAPAPAAAPAPMEAMAKLAEDEECLAEEAFGDMEMDDAFYDFDARDASLEKELAKRDEVRQLFRKLDATEELGENDYYHRTVDQQGPDLVTVNAFWCDFARHRGEDAFLSPHLAQASRNLTEMLLALAVLDLPFTAEAPQVDYEGATMRLAPRSATVVFHEEIKPSAAPRGDVPILVSQNYFRQDDRYRHVDGETVDNYVSEEFLVHVVYQCQVVLTNPTSSSQRLDLLLQIPRGALPVENGFYTKGVHVELHSYGVQTFEYAFYFPRAGQQSHYPVHVARDEELIAAAEPRVLNVVEKLTKVDTTAWAWVSQHAEPEAVLRYMDEHNVERLELNRIAWRLRERGFYEQVIALLRRRKVYHHTTWSYAMHHRHPAEVRQFLLHQEGFLRGAGDLLEGPLVEIDAVRRGWYDHREYFPLVNARAHRLGAERKILNHRFREQFERFCRMLTYRPRLSDEDWLEAAYYLFLQDRVEEGLSAYDRVDAERVAERLQHDYLSCYVAFYRQEPAAARLLASRHAAHPVDKWRKLFDQVTAQLDELEGKGARVADADDHAQRQAGLAHSEPSLELEIEDQQVVLHGENLPACALNFYLMDVELLFSRQPFVQQEAGRFSWITPNVSQPVALNGGEVRLPIPAELRGRNVVVEAVAGALRRSQAHFANALKVRLIENYGQVRVGHRSDDRPLAGVYVKVYARGSGPQAKFYKDGYTDLRGRFDYASLSTSELDGVSKFAVLVLSDEHGAVIREAAPPGR